MEDLSLPLKKPYAADSPHGGLSAIESFLLTLLEAGSPAHLSGTSCLLDTTSSRQWVIGPEPWLVPSLLLKKNSILTDLINNYIYFTGEYGRKISR